MEDILLWLCCFLCIVAEINCRNISSVFSHVATYNGRKCKNALFEYNVVAEMACTSICLGRTDCLGVFYSRSTKLCTGCGLVYENDVEGTTADTKYFHKCPDAVKSGNFGESYYTVFTRDTLFEEAKSCCTVRLNSSLVHIENANEAEFVNDLADEAEARGYWIYLEYDTTDSKWKWGDDNIDAIFTNWHHTEPNEIPYARCAASWGGYNDKWVDTHCSSLLPFVCEKRNNFI